ncbi:hypothetical protein, partial [Acidithiobacillus thiooxidans]|uniref:hypothetical protein n=1 Tax=Acidithiobacillus thiooxidans TaxID=930 RepID=UPI002431BA0E
KETQDLRRSLGTHQGVVKVRDHRLAVETQQVLHGVEPDINMIVRVHHFESPAGASNRFPRLSVSTSSDVLDIPTSFPVAMN